MPFILFVYFVHFAELPIGITSFFVLILHSIAVLLTKGEDKSFFISAICGKAGNVN
jgi:hypothetical protein